MPHPVDAVFVGIDVHKYEHTAVAQNLFGESLGALQFSSDQPEQCLDWLAQLAPQSALSLGLEDVSGYGRSLATALQQAGYTCRYVPPILTAQGRMRSTHPEKTDMLDAKRVAEVILHRGEETLPAAEMVSEKQEKIRGLDQLLQERESLVCDQTALKNQLHALLHGVYGNGYRQPACNLFSQRAQAWYRQDLSEKRSVDARAALRSLERLQLIQAQIKVITKELEETAKSVPEVRLLSDSLTGCGTLTASKIIAEIKNVNRFSNSSKLARYGGFAPVARQSGRSGRHFTDHRGNRKLNRAVHTIALSQIGRQGTEAARIYREKKLGEGKSKMWAMRCLKRHLIRRIYQILMTSA